MKVPRARHGVMERDLLPPSCIEEGNTLRIITQEVDRRENRMKGTDQKEKDEDEIKYRPTKPDRGTIFSILFGVKDEYTVNKVGKLAEGKNAGKNTNVLGILIKQLRFQDKQNDCRNNRSRWMVVFASFWSYFLFAGTRGSMGIIQSEMTQALNAGDVELQWTGALVNSAPLLLAPVISALAKVTSCALLSCIGGVITFAGFLIAAFTSSLPIILVSLGLCPGIGFGLMALSSTFMVSKCFDDRRGLAMALSVAGGGLGFVVFPVVLSALMNYYGLRGTLLLCSALYLHGLVFGVIYRPKEKRSERKENENWFMLKEIKDAMWDKTLFRSTRCLSVILSCLTFGFCDTVPFLFIPTKATRMGFSLELSTMLISIIGFTSISGRIGVGVLSGKSRRIRFVFFVLAFVICSVSMALYALANSYLVFIMGSCLFGVSTEYWSRCCGVLVCVSVGSLYSLLPVVLIDLFGIEKFAASFGVSNFSCGIGSLAAGPVSGALSELLRYADFPFYAAGAAIILGGLALVITKYTCRCRKAKPRTRKKPRENVFVVSCAPSAGA